MTGLHTQIPRRRNEKLRVSATRRRMSGVRRSRRLRPHGKPESAASISIRRLNAETTDREALTRVAGRDSAAAPAGEILGAEIDGRLIAAISLDFGDLVADPFTETADARSLLELRAAQLGDRRPHRRRATPALAPLRRAHSSRS